jgi:TolB-like protein/cytochrome c-type biogenesis protein CcmH/NrfG
VRAAVETQQAVAEHNSGLPENKRIEFRVGINLGDVVIDGDDIHGDGVNVAARLEGLAQPGGICISGSVHEQVRDRTDLAFEDLGEKTVKNIDRPVRVWQWLPVAVAKPTTGDAPLPLPDKPSIAVLPFTNMSGDPEQEYFSDGITEDIITELSRFRELYVIARNSAFSYRDNQAPLQRIGRELGVQYLLAGSLRRQGNRIRVTTHLVEAGSGHQIWAERYDEPVDDLFAAQDEVVRRIVATLVGRIAAERLLQARRKPPESWKAYDYWLQGMAHLRRVDMNSLALARAAFQKSAETDPSYARAYAGIAMTHYHAWSCFNWHSWAGLEEQASDYARKAVALDENDHHAHSMLSTSYVFRREYERARFHIDRAIAINSNDADTLANAALVWSFFGDASKAVESAETAVRLDPHHPDWYSALLGLAYFVGRDYDAAISAMAREPDALCDTRAYLAAAYALVGNAREAERHSVEFLRSRSEHMGGDPATDVKRYMDWLINANAYRRDEDTEHFIAGLRKAGLPA